MCSICASDSSLLFGVSPLGGMVGSRAVAFGIGKTRSRKKSPSDNMVELVLGFFFGFWKFPSVFDYYTGSFVVRGGLFAVCNLRLDICLAKMANQRKNWLVVLTFGRS